MKNSDIYSEIREGHLVTAETKQIWHTQMDLAKQLIKVCNKHDLGIWAAAGTLLGAVRHKGYIPWDDDMDFVMFRKDYDKLLSLADEFTYPYFLQSALNEPGYSRGHAQLRNSKTAAILPSDFWQSFNQGIFIDIFVLDDMPDDYENWPNLIEDIQNQLSPLRFRTYSTFGIKNISAIFRLVKSVIRYNRSSIRSRFLDVESKVKQFPKGKNGLVADVMFCFAPYKSPIRDREWYKSTLWLPFEDMTIPVPVEYDKELRACFGDNYMIPIKTSTMHGSIIFDTKRPYTEVLNELRYSLPLKEKICGWLTPRVR